MLEMTYEFDNRFIYVENSVNMWENALVFE